MSERSNRMGVDHERTFGQRQVVVCCVGLLVNTIAKMSTRLTETLIDIKPVEVARLCLEHD